LFQDLGRRKNGTFAALEFAFVFLDGQKEETAEFRFVGHDLVGSAPSGDLPDRLGLIEEGRGRVAASCACVEYLVASVIHREFHQF
jgi:hypothetical protein